MSKRSDASVEDSAVAFVQSRHGVDSDAVHVRSSFEGETASHVYFKQAVNGVPVANAVANVAFNKANKVVSFGSSFVKPCMLRVPLCYHADPDLVSVSVPPRPRLSR